MPPTEDFGKALPNPMQSDENVTSMFEMGKGFLKTEEDDEEETTINKQKEEEERKKRREMEKDYQPKLLWVNIISISLFHLLALYTVKLAFYTKILTVLWAFFIGGVGGFGVTAGAHRLWAHRSYKAKWPLQVILMICFSAAGQNTIYDWVRDHRVHHKFSETNADPHNANRGFFFAHVGWLMQKKHPDVIKKGNQIDMSDILEDKLIAFHHRFFVVFKLLFCFIIPVTVPVYYWKEDWLNAIFVMAIFRYVCTLNFTWLVNSVAHIWGNRPYDKAISPVQNLSVSIVAMGEGWHNYHHVFPWDYKAAELGDYKFNLTTFWIDQFAKIGWAYDMKTPSKDLVKKMAEKYGDGTHELYHQHKEVDKDGNVILSDGTNNKKIL